MSAMANMRTYEIAFVGLKQGEHEFTYDLDEQFFKEYEANDVDKMQSIVKLLLDKHTGFMLLKFIVGGKAGVNCDRCGNSLQVDLWDEFNMVVKLGDDPDKLNEEEEDPDLFYIAKSESHLNVKDWLYEFVMLSVPTQKFCGDDVNGKSLCNKHILKKLEELRVKDDSENRSANSIWKGLDKFKEN